MSQLLSRRAVLGTGLAVPLLAGCQRQGRKRTEPPVPDAAALDSALADEDHLIAMYDAAMAAAPALARSLRRLRRDHAAHRTALLAAGARAAGAAPIPTPTAAAPARGAVATLRALSAAERAAAAARTAACLAAPRSLAPLFGSIAASEAAHAVAIRA